MFLPENQYAEIYNNIAFINWESAKGGAPYIVSVKNMFEHLTCNIDLKVSISNVTAGTVATLNSFNN